MAVPIEATRSPSEIAASRLLTTPDLVSLIIASNPIGKSPASTTAPSVPRHPNVADAVLNQ